MNFYVLLSEAPRIWQSKTSEFVLKGGEALRHSLTVCVRPYIQSAVEGEAEERKRGPT